MRLACEHWRVAPADFWRMTPRELAILLTPAASAGGRHAPTRARLHELLELFPDRR